MKKRQRLGRRKLSVFTYFAIFSCVVLVSILFIKEIDVSSVVLSDTLYKKDTEKSLVDENRYYINRIKKEYGITIGYGEAESFFVASVNAKDQTNEEVVNHNLKDIYLALKKYPQDLFNIFLEDKYSLDIILVDDFQDNNVALASKNTLNQYRMYISNNNKFERAFHHEMFHVLEYYMRDNTDYLFMSWALYNPEKFSYESNISLLTDEYIYNSYLPDSENKNSYFLTKYSKVSDKEDRSELFAEMMTLKKRERYLTKDSNVRKKIDYIIYELNENMTSSEFFFSPYMY